MKALIRLTAFVAVTLPSLPLLAGTTEEAKEVSKLDSFWALLKTTFPPWEYNKMFPLVWGLLLILVYTAWKHASDKSELAKSMGSLAVSFCLTWVETLTGLEGSNFIIFSSVLAATALALAVQQGVFKGFPQSLFDKTTEAPTTPGQPGTPGGTAIPPGQTTDQTLIHCQRCNIATRGKKFCVVCKTPRDPATPPPNDGDPPPPATAPPSSPYDIF